MQVGHIHIMQISRLCSTFITRGGTIEAVITGSRQFTADLLQGELDIPCKFLEESGLCDIDLLKEVHVLAA